MPHLPTLAELQALTDQVPRGLAAVAGLLVMVAGARLYPFAIMAPGLAAGIAVGVALPLEMEPAARAILAVVLGGVGAIACRSVERMAIWGVGAIVTGGLTVAIWPLVTGAPGPWWAAGAGAVAGLLLFPGVFRFALKPITAWAGATIVAWAAGMQGNLLVIAGLAVLGFLVQLGTGRRKEED
ncbi:MAG: hypothetical protein H6741_24095 [Alphaproteobacteria bacterium]|nr:hypothetical protein [Alphaproteobacteria bacterium]MCB9795789.1 hypothetical protein [Alphaproteobacteria bacterium]